MPSSAHSREALRRPPESATSVPADVLLGEGVGAVEADVRPVGGAHPRVVHRAGRGCTARHRGARAPRTRRRATRIGSRTSTAQRSGPRRRRSRNSSSRSTLRSPARRELHERRARARRRAGTTRSRWLGNHDCRVAQLHAVGAELAELRRVDEARRRLLRPVLDRGGRRQPVERRVELDGVEARRVALEPPPLRQISGIHRAAPVAVHPPGAPDPDLDPSPDGVLGGDAEVPHRARRTPRRGREAACAGPPTGAW